MAERKVGHHRANRRDELIMRRRGALLVALALLLLDGCSSGAKDVSPVGDRVLLAWFAQTS
jgi:outer membrane biogenesis lipoprotein LolB